MNMVIAGGGTGGHLFPGIAIAEEFLRRDSGNQVLFIGTDQGIESRIVPASGYPFKSIYVRGLKGQRIMHQAASLAILPWALLRSCHHLRRFHANIVCGVGGYVSGPVVIAGVIMRMHTIIHEQNNFPGLSNRVLGRYVDRVFISFDESRNFFPSANVVVTGMPLRQKLVHAPVLLRDQVFTIVVLGGSQGSHEINQAMLHALPHLYAVKDRLRIIHQSGSADAAEVTNAYQVHGFAAQVHAFIEDMAGTYAKAHLVISRAGAGTLAELALCGRAALLIPYPHAANNHQEKNARVLVERGAALMILSRELTGEKLAHAIMEAEQNRGMLEQMEQRARSLGKPYAAQEIVNYCYQSFG